MVETSYHHGDLKRTLVAAAREQIATAGVASLNIRALARAIGVTHPAVYRHFADKEALLEAVAEEGFVELTTALTAATTSHHTTEKSRLHALATAYIEYALIQPELTRVMFALISAEARMNNASLYAASKQTYGVLLASVAGDEEVAMNNGAIVWAMLHGLAQLIIEKQLVFLADPVQRAALITKAVDVLHKGLQRAD